MTNPPNTIPFSAVDASNRLRQTYSGIEELANGIETLGLIQPLVLTAKPDGTFRLVAGGRRYAALTRLGCDTLYHATSTVVGKPGFILKGEHGDELMDLLAEISENHDRDDVPWYEELPAVVRAWRLVEAQHHKRGEEITMRAFGAMMGVRYHDLGAALKIWDAFQREPERFKQYSTVRVAAQAMVKESAMVAARIMNSMQSQQATLVPNAPVVAPTGPQPKVIHVQPQAEGTAPPTVIHTVNLSNAFLNCNSLDLMAQMPKGFVNHIVCDPDYAISVERLSANSDNMDVGVAQASVEDSLSDLRRFITLAHNVVDDHGFCVFFMDIEHWQTLRDFSTSVGWRVQRWPLTWRKTDYRSNAAPSHNFCKNEEWAMVLRKPGATLVKAQTSSVLDAEMEKTTRKFNHPFAKPLVLWRWIYYAIAHEGQKVYDPFLGSGTSACAAIECKLQPLGSELSPDHYNNALINIRRMYQYKLGDDTLFT